jgi:hypothetical protein
MLEFINWLYSISKEPISYGASIVTILGLLFIFLQLRDNKTREKRARAFQMIDRYWANCFPAISRANPVPTDKMEPVYRVAGQPISNLRYMDKENQELIFLVIGYFQELGSLWINDLIDKDIIRKNLYSIPVIQFENYQAHIEYARKKLNNPALCANWESMVKDLKTPNKLVFSNWLNELHRS